MNTPFDLKKANKIIDEISLTMKPEIYIVTRKNTGKIHLIVQQGFLLFDKPIDEIEWINEETKHEILTAYRNLGEFS